MTTFLNRRKLLSAALAGAACVVFPVQAFAHRQKRAVTNVEWNPRTHLLEVTHILHQHDAEQALSRLGKLKAPDLTPLRARAQLALYAQSHFKLLNDKGTPLALNIVGAEINSGEAFIYQETSLSAPPKSLSVINTLLLDVYVDQTNLVNVTLGGTLKSLVFNTGDTTKKVSA